MCSNQNGWWLKQCKVSCAACGGEPLCNSGRMATPETHLGCDPKCKDTKSNQACHAANISWAMCSISSLFRKQCQSFCGICTLPACVGVVVDVAGTMVLQVEVENAVDEHVHDPGHDRFVAIAHDPFVTIAVKDVIASMAGHGLDASDIIDVNISFDLIDSGGSSGRRLKSSGNVTAAYAFRVPESLQALVTLSISSNNAAFLADAARTSGKAAVFARFASSGLKVVALDVRAEALPAKNITVVPTTPPAVFFATTSVPATPPLRQSHAVASALATRTSTLPSLTAVGNTDEAHGFKPSNVLSLTVCPILWVFALCC